MTGRSSSHAPPATALAVALLAGIMVAWSDQYWRYTVAVCCISAIGVFWAVTARQVKLPPQTLLVILIGVWGPLQLALHFTRVPWPTLQRSLDWGIAAVAFILASQILRGPRERRAFLDFLLWTITGLAVAAMLQMYLSPGRVFGIIPAAGSVVGTLYYKNQFAALMEMAAPIALWKVSEGRVVSGGLCFAAMFAAALTSESRMGVILIFAVLLVAMVLMVARRRMPARSAAWAAGILALLVAAAAGVAGTEKIWTRLQEPNPYLLRETLLNSTLKMIPTHPWSGSGLGTWPNEYPGFATYDLNNYVNEAHNDWAQWASEGGLPFFLAMAALGIWLVLPALQSVWGLGVISVMVHSYVDYPLRDPALACLWFALAGGLSVSGASAHSNREPRHLY